MPSVRALQENIPNAFSVTGTLTAQLAGSAAAPIVATVGGQQYRSIQNLSLNLATTGAGGLDTGSVAIGTYFLHLVVSSGALALVASLASAPSGFSAYKQIGRVRVGISDISAVAIMDVRLESLYQTEIIEVKNNYIINGAFDFWQRGVSFTTPANGAANADRFKHFYDGAGSAFIVSRQSYSLGQNIDGNPKHFHRLNVTTAGSGGNVRYSRNAIEGVHNLAGKIVTLSFYAAADAARTLRIQIAQNFGTGGSPSAIVSTSISNINISTTYTKYEVTFRVPSISGKTLGTNGDDYIELQIHYPVNTAMTVDIGQIMLNDGAYSAPFSRSGGDIAGELAKCQRYFEKSFPINNYPGDTITGAHYKTLARSIGLGTGLDDSYWFTVRKRSIPIVICYATGNSAQNVITHNGTNRSCSTSQVTELHFDLVNQSGAIWGDGGWISFYYTADAEL